MSARKKASKKKAVRKKATRTKARRLLKKCLGDVDGTTQAEAFQILTDRLDAIYAGADERAGDLSLEIRDLLEGLEQKLNEKIHKITCQTVDEIEDLACDVDGRNEELQDRVLTGDIVETR